MKKYVTGLFIFISSISAWGTATQAQLQQANEVLKRSLLPPQMTKMAPEKLSSYMKEVTYEALRPRDILRLTEDIKTIRHRVGRRLIDEQYEGFSINGNKQLELRKGEILRVVQRFETNDTQWSNKKDFSGVQGEYIRVLEFRLVKLDKNFEPIGEEFNLVSRGETEKKVASIERFDGGFMARNPSLSFNRAGVNDLIVNAQAIDTGNGVIPAFTPAIIIKTERRRINWTISNYDYVFTLHLMRCPEQFQNKKCEVQIKGTKMYANPNWAHYTMPENRRIIKFWGGELHY